MPKKAPPTVSVDKSYQIEDDLRTLKRADEVRRDRGRFRATQRLAKQMVRVTGRTSSR